MQRVDIFIYLITTRLQDCLELVFQQLEILFKKLRL